MTKQVLTILMALMVMGWCGPAAGTFIQVDDVRFAERVDVSNQRLQLHGTSLLKVMVFVKAYAGALYLPETVPPALALEPVAKRLELAYYHPIKREDFAKATRIKIRDNIDPEQVPGLASRIDALSELYRDVQPGDRYALTYIPGQGTILTLNGEPLGTIPGEDFARAVFAIWLGDNPIDEGFRDRLLGVL